MRIPIFIPASPKDQLKLKYCIRQAAKHIPECGDFYISVPDKTNFKDYEEEGHKVFFFDDFDLVPLKNWIAVCRFRPNWIAQQIIKVLQPVTPGSIYFCLDADCLICKQMNLLEDGKPRLFEAPNTNDEAAFQRFIAQMSGGELAEFTTAQKCATRWIADMQLFDRKIIEEMVLRYFPSANDFVNFTISQTYWRKNDTRHSCFISEYQLYGQFVEKFHKGSAIPHAFKRHQIDKFQLSQQGNAWTAKDIEAEIAKAEAEGTDVLKLQTNSPMSDVCWKTKEKK